MKQYLDVLKEVLATGTRQANRTGTDAISIPGAVMKFDLADGFPAVTTKKLFYKGVIAEMLGFLRGYTTCEEFEALGCNWWAKDANENTQWLNSPHRSGPGDLGRIYGAQWRDWRTDTGPSIDQVQVALDTIRINPTSRRIIINAWRPDEFEQMALPPCHVLYQFIVNVEKGELNLVMYQRSCDMFLGVPMNIFGSALLLELVAEATGLRARHFMHVLADAHIYVNAIDQVKEQLTREPLALPRLKIHKELLNCSAIALAYTKPEEIELIGYQSHAAIKAEMVTG